MNPSPDLFFLIKSLTKNEKRYFRLNTSLQQGDKKYIQLFDAISKQDVYDEKKIVQEGKGYITRLNLLKSSLYEKIMDSLDAFHENDSADKWIKKQIRQTDILFKKKLYLQALKQVRKAKRISEKFEKHTSHIELLFWEYELLKFLPEQGSLESGIEKIYREINEYMIRYRNYIDYRYFSSAIFSKRILSGHSRRGGEKKELKKIVSGPLLSDESKALSYPALFYYYSTYVAYYGFINDEEKRYLFTRKTVELFEKHPHEIKENTARYIGAIHNYLNSLSVMKKFDELKIFIEKLKNIKEENDLVKSQLEYFIPQTELHLYIETYDFENGMKLASKLEKKVRANEMNPPNKQTEIFIYYYCAQINLYTGNYKAANYFINRIIHLASQNVRDDVYCFSKILQLIVYFEMEDHELLESSIKSTYRYLLKKERNYKFETLVLEFFRKKAARITSQKLRNAAFRELKKEIELLLEDPFERNITSYFDFVNWLESKIIGRSFKEVVTFRLLNKY